MGVSKYEIFKGEHYPIIEELRQKYDMMFLMGELDANLEKFGLTDYTVRRLIYPKKKSDFITLNFDTIIKLSYMFEIPYEEFINYNATIEYYRNMSKTKIARDDEMLKQYQYGKEWEDEVIKYYSDKDYFVYKIPTMNNGTVFDIFVAKKGSCLMIECKHIDSDKLYYMGSGIFKKRDELDHFIDTTKNNIYIYVKSDTTGTWWTTWLKAKPIFEEKGFITVEDCYKCDLGN